MAQSGGGGGGGDSTLGWVGLCGPKFRPSPYNKTREDANLQPITKPFASWRTLFKTNQYFLPYKLGCTSTFWQPIGKLKGKIQRKLSILQKCDLYLNQFSNKNGAIGKPERPEKHPIWAAHPRTHLSTKYPPPPGAQLTQQNSMGNKRLLKRIQLLIIWVPIYQAITKYDKSVWSLFHVDWLKIWN